MKAQIKVQVRSVSLSQPVATNLALQIKSNALSLIGTRNITKPRNNVIQIGAKRFGIRLFFKKHNIRNKLAIDFDLTRIWTSGYARAINILPKVVGKDYLRSLLVKKSALSLKYLAILPVDASESTIVLRYANKLYPLNEDSSKTVTLKELSMKVTFTLVESSKNNSDRQLTKILITLRHAQHDNTIDIEESYRVWKHIFIDYMPSIENKLPEDFLVKSASDGIGRALAEKPKFKGVVLSALRGKTKLKWPTPSRYEWMQTLKPIIKIIKHAYRITS